LIIATQKVSKTIIDTSLQENMGGRIAFRMATLANSAQVLGSKDAREIPAIEGRCRYQFGTKSIDVQTPYLTDERLKFRLKEVSKLRAQLLSTVQNITTVKNDIPLSDNAKKEMNEQSSVSPEAMPI
jgi:DNA segregation ATPase FtsK/SpoIIIE-like protein